MGRSSALFILATLTLILAACGDRPEPAPGPSPQGGGVSAAAPSRQEEGGDPNQPHPALLDPTLANETAPDRFRAVFATSAGDFTVEVVREWAPRGADRLYNLLRIGFFDQVRFFRVVPGFMAQFGMNGDPRVQAAWQQARIPDDPVKQSNLRGFVTFATGGKDSRTTQLFVNYHDRNAGLDRQGFAPVGKVVAGMEVVDKLHGGYGDAPPHGRGPKQQDIASRGNSYLQAQFPLLDYVKQARVQE